MLDLKNLIRYCVAGVVGVGALVAGLSSYGVLKGAAAGGTDTGDEEDKSFQIDLEAVFGDKVDANYTFDPTAVRIELNDNQYAADKSLVSSALGSADYRTKTRQDADGNEIHKVYTFEGLTAEGYQGDYSTVEAHITLWEDGTYVGISRNDKIYGYWYNVDAEGQDCLAMIDATNKGHDMVCLKLKGDGFYSYTVDCFVDYGWGTRMIKTWGAYYYPTIGMYVDTGSNETPKFTVGDAIDTSKWTAKQVTNKLTAGSIFNATKYVTYTLPSTEEAGEKEVKATWTLYGEVAAECTFNIEIVEAA